MIGAVFVIENDFTPRIAQRQFNRVMKIVWRQQGEWWHRNARPKHFTHPGAREYNYQRRSGQGMSRNSQGWRNSYTGRKFRRWKHTLPLVFSGRTRENTKVMDVRSTSRRVRVVLHGANTLNLVPSGGTINMREEMLRVSPREQRIIEKRMEEQLERRIKGIRHRARRRVA